MTMTYTSGPNGEAIPVGPQITVNIDPSKPFHVGSIVAALHEYQHSIGGSPVPPRPTHDEFGTRLEYFDLPNTFDAKNGEASFMDQHHVSHMSMLAMRMRWGCFRDQARRGDFEGARFIPFDHLTIHKSNDRYLVFLVNDGQPVVLEDDLALFPSDSLCTRLRMLKGDAEAQP